VHPANTQASAVTNTALTTRFTTIRFSFISHPSWELRL
jgi:hypothetical protein